ncbi:helix-turn-helix transcriptional regulator [Streptomyces diastatochromogenes]|uniref:HTH luxR-type domain-containing protein n=1 Tax=Streptomyces diastatochromogenes TaxID=42236 RepID=A0A233SY44_STRDA|nr:LuxR C-terminal-related transcriptional regulator [Streptomyces diastatochromogenes]MCZ0991729.1 LuxR C-terminal-related transcriptional regulator [Streptomyces diastatochromogenes]OXZ00556.1 hypothetical protein BEK98_00350 [Streptomyces diastatochromogenes]
MTYAQRMAEAPGSTARLMDRALAVREAAMRAARGTATLDAVLAALADLVPFEVAGLSRWDEAAGRHINLTDAMPRATAGIIETELHRDPVFARIQRTREALWLSDMPRQLRRMSSVVRDIVEPSGFSEGTTQCLFTTDGRYVGVLNIGMTRPLDHLLPVRPVVAMLTDSLAAVADPLRKNDAYDQPSEPGDGGWAMTVPDSPGAPYLSVNGGLRRHLGVDGSLLSDLIRTTARSRPLPTTILVIHAQQLIEVRLIRTGTTTQAFCRPCGRPGGLSLRELQVMAELTRGLTNREIAGRLSIAVRTVATHIEHILAKLDLPNRAAAAARAAAWGLEPLQGHARGSGLRSGRMT